MEKILRLANICPPKFNLQSFVKSPQIENAYFILDSLEANDPRLITISDETSASTPLIKIYDIVDLDENVLGHLIKHRPMKNIVAGHYFLHFSRRQEHENTRVNIWYGDFIKVLESDNGCVVFNSCERLNAASKRMALI